MASSTLVRKVLLQISADDGDTEEKLDRIKASADELADKHPELKVKIDTAAAAAKMAVLRAELRDVGKNSPIELTADDARAMEKVASLKETLKSLSEQADSILPEVDGKDELASLLGLRAQLESLNDTLSEPEISISGLARAEADIAQLDARLDKLQRTDVSPPTMVLTADDAKALATMSTLKAQVDELTAGAASLKIETDDKEGYAELLRFQVKADDLARKIIDPKIDPRGFLRAQSEIAALDVELDRLKEKGDGPGLLSRIWGGSGGEGGEGGGGMSGALSGIPMLGTLIESPELLAAIVPAVMAVGAEVGGLVTGLAAAGLGIGAFGALAYPTIKKITGALGDTKSQLAALPAPIREAVTGIDGLKSQYEKMSASFEKPTLAIVDDAIKAGNILLPYLGQFANSAAPAIEGVFGTLDKGLASPQFKYFMGFLESLSGPVITAVGSGMKGLAADVMILMERFSKKDVINTVNIAFRVLGAAITTLTGLIMAGMVAWDFITQKALPDARVAFDVTRHAIATAGHDIAVTFDEIRHDAATLAHDTAAHFDEIRHDIAQWADDVRHDTDRVIGFFEALPGRILAGVGDLGHLLWSDGVHIIDGLIGGIESEVGELKSKVTGLAHDVVGWAEDALHINSPSKDFQEIGASITEGLSLGINRTSASVLSETQSLMKSITTAAIEGEISQSQAGQLGTKLATAMQAALRASIGQVVNGSMAGSLESTKLASIGKASIDALKQIWAADSGGLITGGKASSLAVWVKQDNATLQGLAVKRNAIAKEIAAAKTYAANVVSSTESADSLTAAAGSGATPAGEGAIISALQADVTQIRQFKANIAKLSRMGLNKAYIDQLIQAGPASGGPIAAELASGSWAEIRQVNAAESQIANVSVSLGQTAANAMYDSGSQAGKGFLSGLEAQQSSITKLMDKMANSMVSELRKELGIHSPSTVLRQHGLMAGEGLALGLEDSIARVTASAGRLARAAVPGGSGHPASGGTSGGGPVTKVEIRLLGDKQFRTWLKKGIRVTGGDASVVGA